MRHAVAWSYNLLARIEQAAFRRLSVFPTSFSLDSAAAMLRAPQVLSIDRLAALAALVDNSLARHYEGPNGQPRFKILHVIRDYGLERLSEAGEEPALRRAHASYFAAWSERTAPRLWGPEEALALNLLEEEHDNLRIALFWTTEQGEGELALRLGAALWPFWWKNSYLDEGRYWLDRIVGLDATCNVDLHAQVVDGLATLDKCHHDFQ